VHRQRERDSRLAPVLRLKQVVRGGDHVAGGDHRAGADDQNARGKARLHAPDPVPRRRGGILHLRAIVVGNHLPELRTMVNDRFGIHGHFPPSAASLRGGGSYVYDSPRLITNAASHGAGFGMSSLLTSGAATPANMSFWSFAKPNEM